MGRRRSKKTNPCSQNFKFNNRAYEKSKTDKGFDYVNFYNEINYISPGKHLQDKGYYDICIKHLEPGEKWLDVGCGSGTYLCKAVKEGVDVHGIDVVKKSVEIAKGKGIKALKCSACDPYPYPDCHFDLISSTDVLEHLFEEDVCKSLKEIHRVLKDGKYALLASCDDKTERLDNDYKKHFHLTLKTKKEWLEIYCKHGFELVEDLVSDGLLLKKI
jgi:ubiquinone/menaquinone biosynthesis C-methylase UbiE